MKLDTFFEKFDQFAEVPGAVARMRELVLELAVQGKLVRQDSDDEPASIQLERIATQKVKVGRITRVKAKRGGSSGLDESNTKTPDGWAKASLAELVTVLNGRAYSKDELLSAGTPVLRVGNLFTSKHWYYSDLDLEPDKYCEKGDLIFAWSASFGPFIWAGSKVIYHYHIWKLALHSEQDLSKSYLYWFLQNKTQAIKRAGHGVSMLHMTKEKMDKLEVMIPPLAEQKRIVAKVDELMTLCDRLEAQQQERESRHTALVSASLARFADAPTPENLQFLFHPSYAVTPADLRKTILSIAVQGKLVRQQSDDEPVEMLISKLADVRQQNSAVKKKNLSDLKPACESDLPFNVPDSWQWIRLGYSVTLLGGFAYPSGSYVSQTSNQIIRLGNVKPNALLLDQKPVYIDDSLAEETAAYEIRTGDILVTMTGTKTKRDYAFTLTVDSSHLETNRLFLNQRVGLIRPFISDLVPIINLFLKADKLLDMVFVTATGTANQGNIGIASILDLPFPLPPLAEQRRIVAKVDQLMALVDQLEAQLATCQATAGKLLEAVVAELTSS